MTASDDDWSGAAYAQDSRGGDTLAAHLQAAGILPPGHVIVNVQIYLRATVAPDGVEGPYLTVMMFDASGSVERSTAAIRDGVWSTFWPYTLQGFDHCQPVFWTREAVDRIHSAAS